MNAPLPFGRPRATNPFPFEPPEPIAIVGIGCRLPGDANGPDEFWQLLAEGRDAITTTPDDRWDRGQFYRPGEAVPGKTRSQWGGYVRNLDGFDPTLFQISPREAAAMDPQQRMLLEVTYRAIEDAGIPNESIAGKPVSVFTGISSIDYAVAGLDVHDRGEIGPYSNTGSSTSIAANRISYCFDLRGPSVAVDTACSSSLVALHMACQSIWHGDAEAALAGGVNALILPDFFIAFSQLGVLSPDGRCKTFDARANGYARSEGAGMVLMKPLSRAHTDGDRVYCVIRGTALNQDGRTPGLTVPSGAQQKRLVAQACQNAGVDPAQISYVEAHGTGTSVGDPIEASALAEAIGKARQDRGVDQTPCRIGSVKTNVGHLEAGAGITSVIKVALSLHHQQLPPHLHLQQAHPEIDFERWNLRVPTTLEDWRRGDQPRLAGINGFGYGGANAHVILGEAPEMVPLNDTKPFRLSSTDHTTTDSDAIDLSLTESGSTCSISRNAIANDERAPAQILPLSAADTESFNTVVKQITNYLDSISVSNEPHHQASAMASIAGFASHCRTHHDVRAAVVGRSIADWQTSLAAVTGQPKLSDGKRRRGIAFLCCGQGPQWYAMGRGLMRDCAPAMHMLEAIDHEFQQHETSWRLLDELRRDPASSQMHRTSIAQPALFALQVAQAAAWNAFGIHPSVVIGHSVGEIAAAHLSGALDFADACCVAIHRGRTMDLASSRGSMIAAGISEDEALTRIEQLGRTVEDIDSKVSLAAVNGPQSVTLSGDSQLIEQLAQQIESDNLFLRRLAVEYAFHSPQMDPVRAELLTSLADVQTHPTHTPMISTVTGRYVDDAMSLGGNYWWQNVRHGVRFADAIMLAARDQFHVAVELGPHPVLSFATNECYGHTGEDIHVMASARRGQADDDGHMAIADDYAVFLEAVGDLHALGFSPDWSAMVDKPNRSSSAQRISHLASPHQSNGTANGRLEPKLPPLPTYPMRLSSLWVESPSSRENRLPDLTHPLLGRGDSTASPGTLQFFQRVDPKSHGFLQDHCVRSATMFPAAAGVEMAFAASRIADQKASERSNDPPAETFRLSRLKLLNPLVLDASEPHFLVTCLRDDRDDITIAFHDSVDETPTLFASTTRRTANPTTIDNLAGRLNAARKRCTEAFTSEQCYEYCDSIGLKYNGLFRGIRHGVRRDGESVATIQVDRSIRDEGLNFEASRYGMHPGVLDSCFHAMVVCDPLFGDKPGGLYLPHEIADIQWHASAWNRLGFDEPLIAHATVHFKDEHRLIADVHLYREDGTPIGYLNGFDSRRVGAEADRGVADLIYRYQWQTPDDVGEADQSTQTDESDASDSLSEKATPSRGHALLIDDATLNPNELKQLASCFDTFEYDLSVSFQDACETGNGFVSDLEAVIRSAGDQPLHLIYAAGLDVAQPDSLEAMTLQDANKQLRADTVHTTHGLLRLIQSWESIAQQRATPPTRLTILTRGCQSADEWSQSPVATQMPLIGMGRVIISEIQSLQTRLVDLDPNDDHLDSLIQELGRDDAEDEVVLRGHDRLVQRFVPDQDRVQTIAPRTEAPAFRLTKGRSSSLDDLVHQAAADLVPGPREVVIKVAGAGLNFSDVMKVLDLYPGLPPGPVPLGAECSGEVIQTGTRVTEFAVGDKVIAIAPGGFASHVCVEACLVAPAPKAIDLVDAAAIPVAYLTADHAIHTCGKMRSGESILVHAASGGVGLAAIDIAHHAGVEVFATAGTKQKRAAVAKKGVQHLFDSRSLDFADEILSATASRDVPGVDAVLNSLPGEAIRAGLSVLKTGGRFLEIGKRDIYADASLGLYPMRNNLALFAIDLDQLFKQQAIAMGERLRALVAMIDSGDYSPEPPKRFASSDAAEAFKFMRAAKHVGKVVVDYTQQPTSIRSRGDDSLALSDEGTYWVVGGLGGFGLPMARYLAERGVKRLVLSGRRVEPSEHATEIIDSIRGMGTEVELVACDITDADAVEQTVAAIQSSGSPLRGVMHTAMVLEDRLMVDLDLATLHRVLWPKLIGGWNLHHSTKHLPLDHFILFSSLTSVFGHAGQANYSAANAMLDGIAHHRRTHGLPATVINWGHVGEVGYLAERQDLSDRLRRQGVLDFSFDEATRCLATAINRGSTQCSVLRMDWSRWRGLGLTGDVSPRFAHLIRGGSGAAGTSVSAASLRAASPKQRVEMLRESIADKLASLLGCVASEIDADRPMLELGLDSLMAVELRNWIENQLQLKLQIGSLMRGSSLAGLVENLAGMIDQIQVETDSDQTADSSLTASALPTIAGTEPDTRMSDRGRFPMSDQQTGLWYAFRRNPEGTSFNVFLPTRIRSAVNVEALRKSIRSVVARHACLRTTFTDQDGELQQVVHDDLPVEFDVINLADETTRSDEDLVAIAREHVVEETRRPFDLQDGPLLRLKLFQIADDDFIAIAVTHHIVVDFWSLILILNELRSYYPSYAADQTPTIEPPQRDYFDFVAGQRQLLQSARGDQLKRYWTSTLRDIPAVLEVPTDYPRPAAFTGKAKVAAITCPRRVGRRVNELASQCQTTTSSVVLAALQVMLQRLTRQERFIIGSPFAGRTDAELEDTVGFFVNMLPLVADLTGQPSFEQLLRRAGNRLVDSMQHEEYPFAQIVRDLDPPRDTGRSPLIQVSCTFEKAHVREEEGRAGYLFPAADTSIEVGGLNQESFYIPHQTCHYDLEFIFEQSGDDLHGMIVYCEDLYAAETVSRWSTMFVGLLEELLDASRSDQPEQHVSEIGWGDAAWQRHQPRVDQKSQTPHRTNDSKPQHSSIVAWLDESARRFADEDVWYPSDPSTENADPLASPSHVSPDQYRRRSFFNSRKPKPSSPSLSGSDASASGAKPQRLAATLGELRRRVNSIATSLSNAGISKGQLIPVAATASQPAMTMALSVMRAGGVPVPIDVTKPSIDAVTLIQQTSSDLALIEDDSAWSQQLPHHVDCLRWDDARVTRENTRSLPPIESITADDLAYVIFTSGTTGTPKGVMVPHRGIVNTLSWRNRITPIGPGDRVMVPLSHQFDAGFGLSLLTILSGATLVHPGVTDLADIDSVLARMIEAKVSVMVAVPSLMDLIASHPRFGQTSSLRHVWIGGESMPESLPKLIRMGTDAQIWNCYGPTEASVEATAYRIDDLHDRRHVPVGKPADGTDVVVLKSKRLAALEVVPDTVVGEIALVGDGLANGYLGDPELTDTVFVTLPDGRRAYRTGDQGRRRVDGLIEVIGRIDRQIQVGGYRIEPVEVETVLRDHVSVAQAAVVPRTISDVELLVAYVELETSLSDMAIPKANSDAELSTRDIVIAIRHHLAEHLPPYKRPKRIEVVSKLPISASGKVDLASLPKSDASWMDDETVTPPSTSLEKFLAKAWGETLGVDQIGVSQNFFEYGGTSLQAAMLTNRLSEHLAVHVPSSLLFDLADISSMAQRLTQLYPKELRSQFDDESVRFYDGKVFAHQRVTKRDHLIAPLKPTGDQTPVFMVHPPGGIVVCYRELANAMPDDQPLFAIRSRGLHGREDLPKSMTDMAAEYVDAIRSRQASGPYIIGGWSIGGIIASEVVRQLLDSQNDVKRLILLDTSIPSGASDLVPKEDQANVGLEYGIDLTLDELVELKPEEQLPFLWQHAERMGMLDDSTPPDVAAKAIDDLKHLFHHHLDLARIHRIKPIKVDALLVRPSEIPFDVGGSADRGWSHLLRRVDVETIPGHHHSMVQMPAAEKLADVIVASIGGLNVALPS